MEDWYVLEDSTTNSFIGPFECLEDAESFKVYVSETIPITGGQPDLRLKKVVSPQEWAMDNAIYLEDVLL